MDYVIEKDVPMLAHMNTKYPFRDMEIGDSFVVTTSHEIRVVRAAAYEYTKNVDGVTFRTRRFDGGVRIWRVECPEKTED